MHQFSNSRNSRKWMDKNSLNDLSDWQTYTMLQLICYHCMSFCNNMAWTWLSPSVSATFVHRCVCLPWHRLAWEIDDNATTVYNIVQQIKNSICHNAKFQRIWRFHHLLSTISRLGESVEITAAKRQNWKPPLNTCNL